MNETHTLQIFNSIVDGRDGTVDTMGYDLPGDGYFVGGAVTPLVFDSAADANTPEALHRIRQFVTDCPARFIGWWKDTETGKIYIDGTSWGRALGPSMWLAVERGEIAFWDVANAREVRVTA